jgi:predicted glycosyltransferase
LQKYLVDGKLVGFDGVDEAAWIKNATHRVEYNFGKPLIVVREPEEKAVYANVKVDMATLSKKLTNLGKVVFLSRYERKTCEGLIVPKGFIDTASLVAQADLFVGVGGTITREAALQGTPAIVIKMFQDQFVNDFLIKKGFPIYNVEYSETPKFAEKLMGHKCDVKNLLGKLDDPVDAIVDLIEEVKVDK